MSPCLLNQRCATPPPLSTEKYRLLYLGLLVVLNFLVFSLMTHNPGRPSRTATDAEGRDHSVPSTWSSETRLFLPSLGGHPDLRLVSYYKPLSLHGSPGSAIRMSTTICQTLNGKEYWEPGWLCNVPWWLMGHTWPYWRSTEARSGPSSVKDWGKQSDECPGSGTRQTCESHLHSLAGWPWANNLASQIPSFLILFSFTEVFTMWCVSVKCTAQWFRYMYICSFLRSFSS